MSDAHLDPAELDRLTALLAAVGHPDPAATAPTVTTYAGALQRWRGLARATIGDHTWPAHVVDPVRPSDER